MARRTTAERIEQDNQQAALAFFERMLAALPDPRRRQGQRYPLRTVVVTALMAMVCGCDDAEAMQAWAEANEAWLATMLEMPHGAPSQDVFLAVFGALEPQALQAVLRGWAQMLATRLEGRGRHIAVDGKTSRRSFDAASGKPAVHTVSAWMSDAGLVLAERQTESKSNEITAIPQLIELLELREATVTIDAMGCQSKIAETIIERGGHYVLSVKANQATLLQDIEATFAQAAEPRRRSVDELARPALEVNEEVDKGHGRLERRRVSLCRDLSWLTSAESWCGLSFVAKVVRERTEQTSGTTSVETSYFIGSNAEASAASAASAIRRHWSIENQLHWVLDLAFREDEARHRAKNTAQNMTTLRHFALNIIKQQRGRKLGVANARKRAGWDRSYLVELLSGAAQ